MDEHEETLALIEATEPGPLRELLEAVRDKAALEIMRCLDPRHVTSWPQAVHAVYSAAPFSALLRYARSVLG
jgi:hypothetical protein